MNDKTREQIEAMKNQTIGVEIEMNNITGPAQVHMMKFIITFEIMYPTSGMTLH